MTRIPIDLPGHPHEMHIAPGALRELGTIVKRAVDPSAVLLAVDEAIETHHGQTALQSLESAGLTVAACSMTATEQEKSLRTVERLHHAMLTHRLDRHCAVVALGGGIVTDTAGFAAATYLRGVALVNVPTTLLGMVDAAIGGKTGVNVPLPGGGLGKNLVGAFWQPRLIVADPDVLSTLDARDFRCGLAECIKHAMIARPDLLDDMATVATAGERKSLADFIARSAAVKIEIVSGDERESGQRALLNLGHTFAHACESIAELDLRHGEAVAIGLWAAAHCSVHTGRMSAAEHSRLESAIAACGLPTRLPNWLPTSAGGPVPSARLLDAMAHDKKVERGRWRLILPIGIGRAEIVDDLDRDVIRDALEAIGAGG